MLRFMLLSLLLLPGCVSPGKEMREGHPEFWNDVVGTWEIQPGPRALVFQENLQFLDPDGVICAPGERPAHWTGSTPEGTVFNLKQQDWTRSGRGTASLQKVRYLRGQFLAVCHSEKLAYRDYVVFYGRPATGMGGSDAAAAAGSRVMVVQGEDGKARRYFYRR